MRFGAKGDESMKKKSICCRFTDEELQLIDDLVRRGEFSSRSSAVRLLTNRELKKRQVIWAGERSIQRKKERGHIPSKLMPPTGLRNPASSQWHLGNLYIPKRRRRAGQDIILSEPSLWPRVSAHPYWMYWNSKIRDSWTSASGNALQIDAGGCYETPCGPAP